MSYTVQTQTQIYTGVFSSTALTYARDQTAGYLGDYLFFRESDNTYYLVLSQDFETPASCNDATVYVFQHIPADYMQQTPENWYRYVQDVDSFSMTSAGEVFYSSFDGFPHLEGGAAFNVSLTNSILCGICLFALIVRLMRGICR